jgi:hypothetical protein
MGVLFSISNLKIRILEERNRKKASTRIAPSGELKVRPSQMCDDDSVSLAGLNQESSQRKKKVHGSLRQNQIPLDHTLPNHLRRPPGSFEWPVTFFDQTLPWTIDRTEGGRDIWSEGP